MSQFINDMIHMTEGEKLVAYWWLWSGIVLAGVADIVWASRRHGSKRRGQS
jgi:hypothetical protein